MIQSKIFQVEEETPWEDLGDGIQRKVMGYGDQAMLVKVKFEIGAIGQLHEHPHIQVSYVESGSFEATIGDEVKLLAKGDGFYVPSHVVHSVVCKDAGILIDVFTPHRADFL
jgi:quercetin dioxygenase-like cupin family protein